MDSTAGFVLTSVRSSRLGRDKARLPIESSLLLKRAAKRVRTAEQFRATAFVINHKPLTMHDLLKSLEPIAWPVAASSPLENLNTPVDWATR
jgi:hypothetical protein